MPERSCGRFPQLMRQATSRKGKGAMDTIIQIPVELWAHYTDGKIVRWEVSPLESAAYYFGPSSYVFDGPDVDLSDEGPFWQAVRDDLGDDAIIKVGWSG